MTNTRLSDLSSSSALSGSELFYSDNGVADVKVTVSQVATYVDSASNVFNVLDYGAVGDGSHDDTAGIQAAINAMAARTKGSIQYANGGGTIYLPMGTYKVTSTINLYNVSDTSKSVNFTFLGDGIAKTIISSTANPAMVLSNAAYSKLTNFSIQGNGTNAGIQIGSLTTSGTGTYFFELDHVSIGSFTIGLNTSLSGGAQGCCSEGFLNSVVFNSCSTAGFYMNNYNALDFMFVDCGGTSNAVGCYFGVGGSINWIGGSWSNNTLDFGVYSSEPVAIHGVRSEGNAKFADLASASGYNTTLVNVDSPNVSGTNALTCTSPVTIIGCNFNKNIESHKGQHTIGRLTMINSSCDGLDFTSDSVDGFVNVEILNCLVNNVLVNERGFYGPGGLRLSQDFDTKAYDSTIGRVLFSKTLNGEIHVTNLPTSDPVSAGQIWSNSGVLTLSQGNAWNNADKGSHLILDTNNLGVTFYKIPTGQQFHAESVRGTIGKSSGKWYFEVKLLNKAGTSAQNGVGLALSTFVLSNWSVVGAANSVGVRNSGGGTGDVWVNNSHTGSGVSGLDFTTNDVIQVAVDLTAARIWFSLNNTGTWNGGAGTPAAGTGGYDISAIAGTVYPACTIYSNDGYIDGNATVSQSVRWLASFATTTYTAPSGFTNWA